MKCPYCCTVPASGTAVVWPQSQCTVGDVVVQVAYAGVQVSYPGLDVVMVTLPHSLAGRGTVDVRLTVDGVAANIVQVSLR